MIKTFQHKGLEKFFSTGSKAGTQAAHAPRLSRQLARLDVSNRPEDMNVPGWGFHGLQGRMQGRFSVSVNGNWRMTFEFDGADAVLLDYEDYH
jgi:proteic killer suppression protein